MLAGAKHIPNILSTPITLLAFRAPPPIPESKVNLKTHEAGGKNVGVYDLETILKIQDPTFRICDSLTSNNHHLSPHPPVRILCRHPMPNMTSPSGGLFL